MPLPIEEGMAFDEVLAHGESDALYSTLKSKTLDQTAFDLNPESTSAVNQMVKRLG